MYIFEGRGKGATTSLLLEALHNEGIFVTATNAHAKIASGSLENMVEEGLISQDGADYLRNNIFSISDFENLFKRRGRRANKVYFDLGMKALSDYFYEKLGTVPEIVALGNDDIQIVHPREFKESNNSFIKQQRVNDWLRESAKGWKGSRIEG